MSLDVNRLELSPFGMNCYVVRRPGADEAVITDSMILAEVQAILAA